MTLVLMVPEMGVHTRDSCLHQSRAFFDTPLASAPPASTCMIQQHEPGLARNSNRI